MRNNDDINSSDMGVDEDYLDLLRDFNKKTNAPRNEKNRDIYSDSSMEKNTYSKVDNSGIYIGKQNNTHNNTYKNPTPRKQRIQDTFEFEDVYSDTNPGRKDEISDYEEIHKPRKKKRSNGFKVAVALLLVVSIVFLVGAYGFSSAMGVVDDFIKAEDIEHYDGELVSESYVKNILLIGLDKAQGGSSRSDSIIICSVNKNTGKITLTSVLRDTHVYIPGNEEAKINSAYAWGGANLLVQTLESNFGIKIDEYATVDFDMFTKLVDALGGIDVEITEAEADYLNDGQDYKNAEKPDEFESGESVHINGYQALWYSRIRYLDSDFMRTKRQRKVITAIAAKVKNELTPTGIFTLLDTAKAVAPYIETTLSKGELMSLVMSCFSCIKKSGTDFDNMIISQKIPFADTWEYASYWDGSSIAIDTDENASLLYKSVYEGEYIQSGDEE